MTTKQRSKLRSLAQNIEPVGQVGKGGLSENMISGLSDALEKRELVKITVLNNAEDDISDIAAELAEKLGVTQRKISYWERGDVDPDMYSLWKISDFFEVSVDYLIGKID